MEDALLIDAYKQGDMSGFSGIYDKYLDDIYRFVMRKVGDSEMSEDLTSQIWIKIFNNIDSYQPKSWASFKSWIYRIANNSVIDYYRTKKENASLEEIAEPVFSPDFAQNYDNKQRLKKVENYLTSLSHKEQEVVFLRVWDDLSYKEISTVLWISVDNCKQIYSRSIKKVQANITLLCIVLLLLL